jgi:hypothetical protein
MQSFIDRKYENFAAFSYAKKRKKEIPHTQKKTTKNKAVALPCFTLLADILTNRIIM